MRPNDERKSTRVAVAPYQQRLRPNLTPTTIISTNSSAGSKAAALQRALGIGINIQADLTEKAKLRKDKADTVNTTQAAKDHQLGTYDAAQAEKSEAYRKAYIELDTSSKFIDDKAEIDAALLEANTDSMSFDELNSFIDNEFNVRFKGLDDPHQAVTLLPELQKYRNEKITQYTARQQEIVDTTARANIMKTAEDSYKSLAQVARAEDPYASVPFDYKGLHKQIKGALQYNGKDTNDIIFDVISRIAIRNNDPSIVDNLPDTWSDGTPTIKNIPSYSDDLNTVSVKARRSLDIKVEEAKGVERLERRVGIQQSVAAGNYTLEQATGDLENGSASIEWLSSQVIASFRAAAKEAAKPDYINTISTGNGYLIPTADRKEAMTTFVEALPQEAQVTAAIAYGGANDIMYPKHKDAMNMASVQNPEAFVQQFTLYKNYATQNKPFLLKNVATKQSALFDAYDIMVNRTGLGEERTLSALKDFDSNKDVAMFKGSSMNKTLKNVMSDVTDIPWSLSEIVETPLLRNSIREVAEVYYRTGSFTEEQSVEHAVNLVKQDHVVYEGQAFKASQGVPTENTKEYFEYLKESNLPPNVDLDDYEVLPDRQTNDTGSVILVRRGDLPFSTQYKRINLQDTSSKYNDYRRGITQAETAAKQQAFKEKRFNAAASSVLKELRAEVTPSGSQGSYIGYAYIPKDSKSKDETLDELDLTEENFREMVVNHMNDMVAKRKSDEQKSLETTRNNRGHRPYAF